MFSLTRLRAATLTLLAALASACAPITPRVATGTPPLRVWAFEGSDLEPDPAYRFGRLDNGMRYVIRHNETPKGTALVRMQVSAGSLDEGEDERGYAHFVEHMAFNGSTSVPEGEMVRLLERKGLAFGADTNAQTNFEHTTYMLDLPRNDADLIDTALMLMRETASELTITPAAVERERGVILAEMRDRNTWALRNVKDQIAFADPAALYARRLPIGTTQTLDAATADRLRAFWQREYVPAHTTLVVIGDIDPNEIEGKIRARFASWSAARVDPQPSAGPVKPGDKGRTDIYLDPALSERVSATRNGKYVKRPDSVAEREENTLREIGYNIVNRRMQRLARQPDPPFRGAGFGTGETFKAGRSTNLVVDAVDGQWRKGLIAAAIELRRALKHGFTQAEVDEQIANTRTGVRNAVAGADTRSNASLVNQILALIREERVPTTPHSGLARFESYVARITPAAALAAMKREAVPLKAPLIRLQGRKAVPGGEAALRAAWNEAMTAPLPEDRVATLASFGYTDFGKPGAVIADSRNAQGIRTLRFANGVMLNLRTTTLEKDRVSVALAIDGGDMLRTRANPLATEMVAMMDAGGLGIHSQDELVSVLAGRSVGGSLSSSPDTFNAAVTTTPADLTLQMQLLAAMVSDPGYRSEGELRYRLNINNAFARLHSTPGAALGAESGAILSDNDPRFSLQKIDEYRKLTFARLKADIGERLAKGAIEIGMVGDFDEDKAIAAVAATFGALPEREPQFGPWPTARQRSFTAKRGRVVIRHSGPADQAMLYTVWPTRDDSDAEESIALELLERALQIELTETLREKLGQAYSPGVSSSPSRVWPGYGTFAVSASVSVANVATARAAIAETLAALRDKPVSEDELLRARRPLVERLDNMLKGNGGWLALVARAQSDPERNARFLRARALIENVTPARLQAMAKRYLVAGQAVEIVALPENAPVP